MSAARPGSARLRLACLCAGAALALLLAGCFGGQTGQEDSAERQPVCAFERTEVAPDERAVVDVMTGMPFSAAEVEVWLQEPATSSLRWHRMSAQTELTLTVLEVRARYVDTSTNSVCPDKLILEARVAIETADGLLDEQLDAVIEADAVDRARIVAEVPPADVAGALTPELLDLDLRLWRDPVLAFRLERGEGGALRGVVDMGGGDPDPGDNQTPTVAAIAELPAP